MRNECGREWVAAYNRLLTMLDGKEIPTFYSGGDFQRTV